MKKILILWVAGILLLTACAAPVSSRMVITFTVDEKCTMQGPTTIAADKVIPVDIVGNIKERGNIGLAILTLDPGKTIKDLQALQSADQPSWSQKIAFYSFPSDDKPYSIDLSVSHGPIYFVCFYDSPVTKIGALGPVEVKE